MLRSPIFLFLLLFILYSCKEKVKTTAQSKAQDTLSQNSLQARRLLDLGMANYANHDVILFNGHYTTMLLRGWWHEYTINPKPWWN